MAVPNIESRDLEKEIKRLTGELGGPLARAFGKIPEKHQKYILANLIYPNKSDKELRKLAGVGEKASRDEIMKSVEGKLGDVLAQNGIREQQVVKAITECLTATKPIIIKTPVYKDGKVEKYTITTINAPDYATRLKTAEMICKLGGYYPATKLRVDGKVETTHRVISDSSMEKLMEREKQQRAEIPADFTVENVATG